MFKESKSSTKKELHKKLESKIEKTTNKKERKKLQEANLDLISAHPRKQRAKLFGEVIQMDASLEIWFGCVKFTLLLAVDEATGRIVAAIFRPQETLEGYYTITK